MIRITVLLLLSLTFVLQGCAYKRYLKAKEFQPNTDKTSNFYSKRVPKKDIVEKVLILKSGEAQGRKALELEGKKGDGSVRNLYIDGHLSVTKRKVEINITSTKKKSAEPLKEINGSYKIKKAYAYMRSYEPRAHGTLILQTNKGYFAIFLENGDFNRVTLNNGPYIYNQVTVNDYVLW